MSGRSFALVAIALAATPTLQAADGPPYPSRPIRWIVPYAPGGSADTVTRLVAQKLTESLRQQVVVDNRPGANGHIGMRIVAEAAPDGHTLVLGYITNVVIDPVMHPKLPYDPRRDFTPVTQLVSTPNLIVVHPSVPAKTVKELIAYARSSPKGVNFASSGAGSVGHLTGELLNRHEGVSMLHVQYKGGAQAAIDLLAGQIQMMMSGFSSTLPHIRSGRLRALAITSVRRSPALPELPTLAEAGYPGLEATAWHGMLAPARTPRAIVQQLQTAASEALGLPDVRERLAALGFDIAASTPAAFAAFIDAEARKWAPVVQATTSGKS